MYEIYTRIVNFVTE